MPRTADGKPDFNGIYEWPHALPGADTCRCSATIFDRKNFAPLLDGGEPFLEPRTGDPRHDEPRAFCMPAGFPSGMLSANAMQFAQTRDYLIVLHEFQGMKRIIPLDGRPHRKGHRAVVLRRFRRPLGRRHARHRDQEFQALVPRRLLLHRSERISDAQRCAHRHGAHQLEEPDELRYVMTLDDPKIFKRRGRRSSRSPLARSGASSACSNISARRTTAARAASARRPEKRAPTLAASLATT